MELKRQPRLFWLLAAAGTAALLCYFNAQDLWPYAPGGQLRIVDFSAFWAAGQRVLDHQSALIYDPDLHTSYQAQLHHAAQRDPLAYPYPPHSLLLVWVLGLFRYGAAWIGFVGLSAALWWAVLHHLTKDRIAAGGMALALGGATQSILLGQNGMVSAALITAGLLWVPHRKTLAGVCFALLTMKPQLGLCIFVALVVWREWAVIRAAIVATLAMVALTFAMFGPGVWLAFGEGSRAYAAIIAARQHQVIEPFMQSVFALVVSRAGFAQGMLIQAVCALLALIVVVRISHLTARRELRAAAVIAATLLTTPFLYLYDTTMLTAAAALLFGASEAKWERATVLGAALLPGAWFIFNVSIAPFAAAAMLAIAYGQALAASGRHEVRAAQPLA